MLHRKRRYRISRMPKEEEEEQGNILVTKPLQGISI
jgi:hypothetical protein